MIRAVIFLILGTLFTSCSSCEQGKGATNSMDESPEQVVRINLQGDPSSLHPHQGIDLNCRSIQKALFEGLTRLSHEGIAELAAAQSMSLSPSKTVYTFYLRPLHWSNGEPVTAYDYERTWKKGIAPGSDCLRADLFYPIKNAQKAKKNEVPLDEVGVKAVDANTLVIELEHPTPYFLDLLSNPLYFPIYQEEKEPSVFNGPFTVASWERGTLLRLARNDTYWDQEAVKLSEIHISMVNDPGTALFLYEKGEIDYAGSPFLFLPLDALPRFEETGEIYTQPIAGIYWFCLNTEEFPLNSSKIRKALSFAINRKEIAHRVLEGEIPCRSIVPLHLSLLAEDELYPDGDIEKARALFAEGLEELHLTAAEFPSLQLSYSDVPGQKTLAQAVQRQWKKSLNIDVELQGSEWNVFMRKLIDNQFQIGGCIWYALFNDPIYTLEFFKDRSNRYNTVQWENPHYQKLLDLANREVDPDRRKENLRQAEKLFLDEMPVIPLYAVNAKFLKREGLKGIYLSDLGMVDFKHAFVEAKKQLVTQ